MKNKLEEETLKIILEGSSNKIVLTDNGHIICGNELWMLKELSDLIYELRVSSIDESMLKKAIKHGLDAKVEKNEKPSEELEKELEKEFDKFLKILSESLSKGLEELEKVLGDK